MDRSFLYGIIVLLGITDAMLYIQKTDPNLFGNFLPGSHSENWQKDPSWSQKPEQEKKEEKKEQKKEEEEKKDDKLDENKSPENQEQGRRRHFRLFRSY